MAQGAKGGRPQSAEFASLAERMGSLQALRVALAVLVLGAALLVPDVIGATLSDLIFVTAGYLMLTALAEGLRRVESNRGLAIVTVSFFVDGLYLAWITYLAGGAQSPLRFLLFVHVIAVTLLASYRTGLKVTLWHCLLSFVVYYAQAANVLEVKEGIAGALPGEGPVFNHMALFNITALLVVAIVTARFSALNERELKRRKGDMEDLARMGAALENTVEPNEIAQIVLDSVCDSFGFKRGVLLTGTEEDMQLAAYRGPNEAQDLERPGVDAVVAKAAAERKVQLKKQLDQEGDPRLATLIPFAKNVAVFPMAAEGKAVGALVVEHSQGSGKIERRVVDMVVQFTAHGVLALQNARLYKQVQKQAETDALTGVSNRRTFEATLERELSRGSRNGEQVTLAMFDIDHFKSLNDTYGHQTGDDVLKKVAAALVEASRDFDTVARYGGEEFAVILPACSSKESLVVAERLRKAISEVETVTAVTASAGVATYQTHASDPYSLIKAADEALYESKRGGRDRVTRSRRRPRQKDREMQSSD
jgi:two-component system, cell cycle response regulator